MGIATLLVAVLASFSSVARADQRTYAFQVTATTGPLAGTVAVGTFSFDDSIVIPDTTLLVADLLTDLRFTWNGITYDETTANTGFMRFDRQGELVVALVGTTCGDGMCTARAGLEEWWGFVGTPTEFFTPEFLYTLPGTTGFYRGTAILLGRVTTVPDQIADLGDLVADLADVSFSASLENKLRVILSAWEAGRTAAACHVLSAFINQVAAQAGHQLTVAQAERLIQAAMTLAVALGCS